MNANNQSLRQRTVSGLSWRFLTVVSRFVLQFGVGVLLARLLPPEDFGLVGLALVIIGFGKILNDLGLAESIVQQDELTSRHVRAGFTCSVLLGVAVAGITYAIAPRVAEFFGDARVTPLLRLIAVSFVFAGFAIVSEALLKRRLAFERLMIIELVSYVIGYGLVAVTLALKGFGEWSLAWGHVAASLINAAVAYGLVRHAARPLWASAELKELAGFGAGSSLLRVFNYFALQGDYFVVGRLLGPGPLGLYTRAYQLMQLPLNYTGQVISSVLFPAISRIQKRDERVRAVYATSVSLTALVVLPSMVLLVVLAPDLILGIYGAQWAGAIVPLQVLAGFGIFRTVYHVSGAFVKAKGFVYRLASFQVIYAAAVVGGAWWGGQRAGIDGVALAVGGAILLMYVLVTTTANSVTGTSTRRFFVMHVPGLIAGFLTAGMCLAIKFSLSLWGWPHLVVLGTTGVLTVAGVIALLRMLPAFAVAPVTRTVAHLLQQNALPASAQDTLSFLFPRADEYASAKR